MASWRTGGGLGRGTYLVLAWTFTLISLPFIVQVVTTGVKIAIGSKHDIPWWGGDAIVIGQIGVTPLQFISLSRATSGSMRASFAALNALALLILEIVAMRLLAGH